MIARFGNRTAEYRQAITEARRKDINLTVPDDGYRYVQFKHDWEVMDGATRQANTNVKYAFPAIVRRDWGLITQYQGVTYDYVSFPREWQFFLHELFRWSVDDKIPVGKIEYFYNKPNNFREFAYATPNSLTWYYVNMIEAHRAWTESASTEAGFCDFVTSRNLGAKPYEFLLRPTTGNIARVLRDMGSEWELEALDITKPPPPMAEVTGKNYLTHWATEITTNKLPDGRYVVSNFPQCETVSEAYDLPYRGTPYPFISMGGTIRIKKYGVRLLEAGKRYSPYVP